MTSAYFFMLAFVFATLVGTAKLYFFVMYKLGAERFSVFDEVQAVAWATLGTIFFHNIW